MIRFSCSSCRKSLKSRECHAGKFVVCPTCHSSTKVPKEGSRELTPYPGAIRNPEKKSLSFSLPIGPRTLATCALVVVCVAGVIALSAAQGSRRTTTTAAVADTAEDRLIRLQNQVGVHISANYPEPVQIVGYGPHSNRESPQPIILVRFTSAGKSHKMKFVVNPDGSVKSVD